MHKIAIMNGLVQASFFNRPNSFFRYWTGTSLQWRFMKGNITEKRFMSFTFEKIPCCTLVLVLYREYEYGILCENKNRSHNLKVDIIFYAPN